MTSTISDPNSNILFDDDTEFHVQKREPGVIKIGEELYDIEIIDPNGNPLSDDQIGLDNLKDLTVRIQALVPQLNITLNSLPNSISFSFDLEEISDDESPSGYVLTGVFQKTIVSAEYQNLVVKSPQDLSIALNEPLNKIIAKAQQQNRPATPLNNPPRKKKPKKSRERKENKEEMKVNPETGRKVPPGQGTYSANLNRRTNLDKKADDSDNDFDEEIDTSNFS